MAGPRAPTKTIFFDHTKWATFRMWYSFCQTCVNCTSKKTLNFMCSLFFFFFQIKEKYKIQKELVLQNTPNAWLACNNSGLEITKALRCEIITDFPIKKRMQIVYNCLSDIAFLIIVSGRLMIYSNMHSANTNSPRDRGGLDANADGRLTEHNSISTRQ